MLLLIIRVVYFLVCAGAIVAYIYPPGLERPDWMEQHSLAAFFLLLLLTQILTLGDLLIRRKRIEVVSSVYFGLMIGFLLSLLLVQALSPVLQGSIYRSPIVLLVTLALPYVCISLLLQTKDEFRFVIPYVEFMRELKGNRPLILDSSALIDGRISDLVDTNIIDSELVVPQFVLLEVQEVADSNDKVRRTRGRRGLEVLNKLQSSPHAEVTLHDGMDERSSELPVDQRIIELAKQLGGRVVTNDFNLNKVAGVQGVSIVNLNDVANALKPRYLPGERLQIRVIKEGESAGQGVGYLDDGTMVVCEQASHLIGKEVDVIVTSVLQSSAGRMIFVRQVHSSGN